MDDKPSIPNQIFRGLVIGVLIAIVVTVVLSSIGRPRHGDNAAARVLNDANDLAFGMAAFEDEYGKLPNVPSMDFELEGPQAVALITVLLGKEDTGTDMQNRRQIAFLTMRTSKNKKQGGLVMSPDNKPVGIYDSWGNPLRVILRPPGKTVNVISYRGKRVSNDQPAVVLSRGKDGKWDTEDDLMSASGKP